MKSGRGKREERDRSHIDIDFSHFSVRGTEKDALCTGDNELRQSLSAKERRREENRKNC